MASDVGKNPIRFRLSPETRRRLDELQVEILPIGMLPNQRAVIRAVLLQYRAKDGEENVRIVVDDTLSDPELNFVVRKELLHLRDDSLNQASFSDILRTLEIQNLAVPAPALTLPGIIIPERKLDTGTLIVAHTMALSALIRQLGEDWRLAYDLPSSKWEEIVAGAFDLAGFDEVILTPRSGDHGRDVIAVRKGVGSIKIISSVTLLHPRDRLLRHRGTESGGRRGVGETFSVRSGSGRRLSLPHAKVGALRP